jgi:hypothetical protein
MTAKLAMDLICGNTFRDKGAKKKPRKQEYGAHFDRLGMCFAKWQSR